jgi:hypothetical protein
LAQEIDARDDAGAQVSMRSQPQRVRRHVEAGAADGRLGSAFSIPAKCQIATISNKMSVAAVRIIPPELAAPSSTCFRHRTERATG